MRPTSVSEELRQQLVDHFRAENARFEEAMLASGKPLGEYWRPEIQELAAQKKASEILPFAEQILRERGGEGPLTREDIHKAAMLASEASVQRSKEALQKRANELPEGYRKDIARKFAEMIEVDQGELSKLRDPNVTEDQVKDFSRGVVGRFGDLHELMRKRQEEGFAKRAEELPEESRGEFMRKVSEMVELSQRDLARLGDPNLTHEQLDAINREVARRFAEIAEMLKNRQPDQPN